MKHTHTDHSPFLRAVLILSAVSLLVGLSAFAYLGTFTRYGADDYCFSRRLMQTDNLLEATVVWYLNTSNRYTTMPLVGMSEWFGTSAIQYLPVLAIVAWVASLSWTMAQLARKLKFPHPWLVGFVLAGLIAFFSILEAPNRYQSLYWRSGMVTYFTPLIAFSLLAGLILAELWREQARSKSAWRTRLVVIWLGFFLAGGLSETALAIQGGALGFAILIVWFLPHSETRNRALTLLVTALSASIIALVVIFLSPANALRVRVFGEPPPVMDVLKFSLIYAWDFIRDTFTSLPTPTFISMLTAGLLGYILSSESEARSSWKTLVLFLIVVPVMMYLLIFFSMTPSMYGQRSFPGARALMVTRTVMVTGLLTFSFLAGALLRGQTLRMKSRVRALVLTAGLLLFGLAALYPAYSTVTTFDESLYLYSRHAQQWDERDAYIRAAVASGATELVVVQINSTGGVLEYKGDPRSWVNMCAAEYYGLKSLKAP